jgi:hypothetical protein
VAVFRVQTSQGTDPTGTPTYAIVDASGTAVSSGNATVVGGGSGQVTAPLAGVAAVAHLEVTWTATVAGATVIERDQVEIVGGFFFDLAAARDSDESLEDTAEYTTADLAAKRVEVERECELICDRAFVPRYARVVLDGSGTSDLILRHPDGDRSVCDIRAIRSISVAPELDETFVAFDADELADVAIRPDGVTLRRAGGGIFTWGSANVVVEYEYGLDAPPPDLVDATLTRLRSRLNRRRTGIPERASSFTNSAGDTYRLTLPGAYTTGIPDVDAEYTRYSRRYRTGTTAQGGGARPASRTLTYTPQYYSLFHGRR